MPNVGDKKQINGKTMVFNQNHRWEAVDAGMQDLDVRTNGNTKEYRLKGTNEWKPVDDSQAGMVAQDMDATEFNSEAFSGVSSPKRQERQRKRPKVFGNGTRPSKPWNYDSPAKFLEAWATKPPSTKIGRFLFDTVNTMSWFKTWMDNREEDKKYEAQYKAVENGVENAQKNFHNWCGGIDPTTDLDKVSVDDINEIYTNLEFKLKEMDDQYQKARGKTDNDSLQTKAEYKAYLSMYNKMQKELKRAQAKAKAKAYRDKATKPDSEVSVDDDDD